MHIYQVNVAESIVELRVGKGKASFLKKCGFGGGNDVMASTQLTLYLSNLQFANELGITVKQCYIYIFICEHSTLPNGM